jgi:RepB DNA-primase from phage plasmid
MNTSPTVVTSTPVAPDYPDTPDLSNVTNEIFLAAIFGTEDSNDLPLICGVTGHPKTANGKEWNAKPWVPGQTDTGFTGKNAYYSSGTFHANAQGQWKRTDSFFAGLSVLVFDDVGVKATDTERLAGLQASYVIETSPGNFQVGYILAVPIADKVLAKALIQAVIDAGLSDPGANGVNRLARLPNGVNGKYDPPFQCRLVSWNPELRYTPEEIIAGLKLDLDLSKLKGGKAAQRHNPHEDDVYTPKLAENPVITALKQRNYYKSPLGDGKHDITCPWVTEHTDHVDGGTAYWEPDDAFPKGGFKCLHGHCAERHLRDLIEHLGVAAQEAGHKPVIRVVPGEIGKIVSAAEFELAQTRKHYQRGSLIVSVSTDPGTEETAIKELNPQNLVLRISEIATWMKYDSMRHGWVVCDPPPRHSRILYDLDGYPSLPVLLGLSRQPYLRPDGSLMSEAGYDPLTKLFGVFDSREFKVPAYPTRDDAMAALKELQALLTEFPFAEPCDLAAALSAILTAAIRASLKLAPMFHVRAPQIASGKSYLCTLIVAFAGPVIPSAIAFPTDDEECRKLLLATLLTSPTAVIFDNLTGDLTPYKSLCSALTEEFVTGRILGVSKTATVGTRALFLSSGNNVDPVRDMARRCITIRLDPQCEVPATREFNDDPVSRVRRNRGHYVSLALTIIRAWITAGSPTAPIKPLASFDQWSDLARQPLVWLGLPDPATALFETMAADPDRETLGRLMERWHKYQGSKPTMVRDLVKLASQNGKGEQLELHDLLLDIANDRGEVDRRRLGWWIKKHANRPVDGLKIERAAGTRNADQWVVVSVSSDQSEASRASASSTQAREMPATGQDDGTEAATANALITAYVPTEPTEPTPTATGDSSEEVL